MKDGGNVDDALINFIYSGYSNWKNAIVNMGGGFSCHERSRSHKTALEVVVSLPQTTKDVREMLSSKYAEEKRIRRLYLYKNRCFSPYCF